MMARSHLGSLLLGCFHEKHHRVDICLFQTVAAKEDESGAADQADLGPNGSPRSKNYGQSIQR